MQAQQMTRPAQTVNRRTRANAIRFLSMDAVQAANSGHPGAPLGMADIADVLWNDHLRHNPANPHWPDRDRFVLSNGHGSMLLYALLHLSGYDLPLAELKQFRQLHSRTAGHPEYGHTPGVETTTGPLGQGLANAVGMALAERTLAAQFNRPGHDIVNHHTYVFLGDGCLMEGISHEACSLAGTLGLGKLIAVYDDNGISIDGNIAGWFGDDTPKRFEAYGWHVIPGIDGHDPDAIDAALDQARAVTDKPSLLCCKTVIGWGAPNKAGGHDVHGAPLGNDEIAAARQHLDWPHAPFVIPDEIYAGWDARIRGRTLETEWQQRFNAYRAAYPELAAEFERRTQGHLPADFAERATAYQQAAQEKGDTIASRVASQRALNAYGPVLPELLGGSADLTPSNNTTWSGTVVINADPGRQRASQYDGNYLHYGVREFGMGALMNGIALHGGFIPYGGTFLVFSDYARSSLRMAALMRIRSLFVLTHDSIGLGEDGPTHQPVEHIASLRLIPHLHVWRPGDAVETAVAWQAALERRDGPAVLALSRQNLPHQPRTPEQLQNIHKGGYILLDPQDGTPDAIVMATGSELGLAMQAAQTLNQQGRRVRVVSMPCLEVFEQQTQDYRDQVLPPTLTARVAIEAGVSGPWYRYVGPAGRIVALDRFGESAPGPILFKHFGFTVEHLLELI